MHADRHSCGRRNSPPPMKDSSCQASKIMSVPRAESRVMSTGRRKGDTTKIRRMFETLPKELFSLSPSFLTRRRHIFLFNFFFVINDRPIRPYSSKEPLPKRRRNGCAGYKIARRNVLVYERHDPPRRSYFWRIFHDPRILATRSHARARVSFTTK